MDYISRDLYSFTTRTDRDGHVNFLEQNMLSNLSGQCQSIPSCPARLEDLLERFALHLAAT